MIEAATFAPNTVRDQWLETVRDFCNEVTGWSEAQGWTVTRKQLDITEELLGSYVAPLLTVQTEHGAVMVEPIGRAVIGAAGRIDLYAYPTLFRVMLLQSLKNGQWLIRTDSGIFLKQPWNEATFVELVADLTGASSELPTHSAA
jgi:hypothetical protein